MSSERYRAVAAGMPALSHGGEAEAGVEDRATREDGGAVAPALPVVPPSSLCGSASVVALLGLSPWKKSHQFEMQLTMDMIHHLTLFSSDL